MALVGAPLVTPVALQNALLQSRRVGNPNDPYGTIAAMRSVGDSYINSQNQLQELAQSANKMAEMDSGLYPARAEAAVATANNVTAQQRDRQEHLQDLQRAVKETMAEGIVRADPRFMASVQSKLQNYHAMKEVQPEVDKSVNEMQKQRMQKTYVEQQIPRVIALKQAADAYPAMADVYAKQLGLPSLPPNSAESKLVWRQVIKAAVDNVKALGLKANIDPVKGIVTLVDNEGKPQDVPWEEVGRVMRIGGDPQLDQLYNSMFQQSVKRATTDTATTLGASRAGLSDAQANRALSGIGTGRAGTGRVSDHGAAELAAIGKDRRKVMIDKDMTPEQKTEALKYLATEEDRIHKLYGEPVQPPLTMEVDPAIAAGRAAYAGSLPNAGSGISDIDTYGSSRLVNDVPVNIPLPSVMSIPPTRTRLDAYGNPLPAIDPYHQAIIQANPFDPSQY